MVMFASCRAAFAELEEARRAAPIASVQNVYNLADRHHDPVIDHTAAARIAFLPYFPLAIGEHTRAGGVLAEVASEVDASPGQVALAWLLHRAPNIIPIPGTTSIVHLEENTAAARIRLTDDQIQRISTSVGRLG